MVFPLQQPCFCGGEYRLHHLRHLGTSLYDGLWLCLPRPQNETRGAESITLSVTKKRGRLKSDFWSVSLFMFAMVVQISYDINYLKY